MMWLQKLREEASASEVPKQVRHGLATPLELPAVSKKYDTTQEKLPTAKNALIIPLKQALQAHAEAKRWYASTLTEGLDKHHLAKCERGIFIHVPVNTTADISLNPRINKDAADHILLVADPGSKVSITDNIQADCNQASRIVEIIAKNNTDINYKTLAKLNNTFIHSKKTAMAAKDVKITWVERTEGKGFYKSETTTHLNGPNSTSEIRTSFRGRSGDIGAKHYHNSKQTKSSITQKAALEGKAALHGLVKISPDAHGSEGTQNTQALLLSPEAEAQAIPQLEVENDDVTCTHSATITPIDEEQVFYLRTRGLTRQEAKNTILEGFL